MKDKKTQNRNECKKMMENRKKSNYIMVKLNN